eukprot:898302_1
MLGWLSITSTTAIADSEVIAADDSSPEKEHRNGQGDISFMRLSAEHLETKEQREIAENERKSTEERARRKNAKTKLILDLSHAKDDLMKKSKAKKQIEEVRNEKLNRIQNRVKTAQLKYMKNHGEIHDVINKTKFDG